MGLVDYQNVVLKINLQTVSNSSISDVIVRHQDDVSLFSAHSIEVVRAEVSNFAIPVDFLDVHRGPGNVLS